MQGTRGASLTPDDPVEPSDADTDETNGPDDTPAGADRTPAPEDAGTPDEPPPAPRRLPLLFAAVAVFALGADQLTKALALRHLDPGEPVDLVGSLLRLHLVRNPGAAFSIGTGFTLVLTLVASAVVIVVLRLSTRLRSVGWTIALGLLLGGALGNLTDRFFRDPSPLRGHVIDFLELPYDWPVFNLADTAVVSAAVLMVLQTLRGVGLDGRRAKS
jgi:signal peptidase II